VSDHGALIDRYEQGAQLFVEALGGVPPADLDRVPGPGKWTIRQIAIHTTDAELVFSARIRTLAGQNGAKIIAFNQDNWAAAMAYDRQPVEHTVTLFKTLRAVNAAMLRVLPESAWAHVGRHEERGPMTIEDMVNGYIRHGENHSRAIRGLAEQFAGTAAVQV